MKLAMVGIIVKDMDKAISFYKCLGLAVSRKYSPNYVELEHESLRISLNTQEMIEDSLGFKPSLSGERIELAFEFDSSNEIDSVCDRIANNGYTVLKSPWTAPWGQYYALIEDVDGTILSLFSER